MKNELSNYFELWHGKSALASDIGKPCLNAVEVLIFDKRLVAQQRLWDNDELIIPSKSLIKRESPDTGEFDNQGNRY